MKFPEKLEKLIRRTGKTQQEIAADLDMRPSRISGWKAGITPELSTIRKLADYFDVPASVLSDDDADLGDAVHESPAAYGAAGKSSDLERRIEEHRNCARIFLKNGWAIETAELLTLADVVKRTEAAPVDHADDVWAHNARKLEKKKAPRVKTEGAERKAHPRHA